MKSGARRLPIRSKAGSSSRRRTLFWRPVQKSGDENPRSSFLFPSWNFHMLRASPLLATLALATLSTAIGLHTAGAAAPGGMGASGGGVGGNRTGRGADVASPRNDRNSQLAHTQLLDKAKQGKGKIDVYFEGDSIVRRWGATDYPKYLANWKENFFGWNAADFGWGADR